jgi:hypothetical protein
VPTWGSSGVDVGAVGVGQRPLPVPKCGGTFKFKFRVAEFTPPVLFRLFASLGVGISGPGVSGATKHDRTMT